MKMTATFNEAENNQLQAIVDTFKAQGANIKIAQINDDGSVNVALLLVGCKLEGERGIELQGKLFEQPNNTPEEVEVKEIESVEGEVVD